MFELTSDPYEHHDLAKEQPAIRATLREALRQAQLKAYQPNRGPTDSPLACQAAQGHWKGFWGPWIGVVDGDASPNGMQVEV